MNRAKLTAEKGQSLWLDDIRRDFFSDGSLSRMLEKYGVTGLTSNPSIFEKSISDSSAYSESLNILAARDFTGEEILENLSIEDIQRACDLLYPVYVRTGGQDGYASLEISPLVPDAAMMISEAGRLFEKAGRKNLMIKIPATSQGLEALETLVRKGVNVNATLIFSADNYLRAAQAYKRAAEYRAEKGLSPDVFSVASFFVSRIDTETDLRLEEAESLEGNPEEKAFLLSLRGKTAVSCCLLAYKKYLEFFYSENFSAMAEKGFRPQKILWASTSAKNPAYNDTIYLDALCLPGSVNTAPENTIAAFDEHGDPDAVHLDARYAQAVKQLNALNEAGINLGDIMAELQKEGLEKFIASHKNVVSLLENKKKEIKKMQTNEKFKQELFGADVNPQADLASSSGFAQRLWQKDASLWKTEPDHVKNIKNSLGWLDLPYKMLSRAGEIEKFAEGIRKAGFTNVVILGMGGSSLAPEVYRSLFQKSSHPKLFVLDTTNPDWIGSTRKLLDLKKTLFVFSSKSGGTVEPNSQFRYFWAELKKEGVKKPGDNFIAITDKNTSLEALAVEKNFRRTFINPSDIGGRFSALSYFGLIPAALCGADIRKLLERAVETADACQKNNFHENPGVFLGSAMANAFSMNRDKLTVILPKKMKTLGLWIEQLVAESTGKEGKGIVPVCEDELRPAGEYQKDRFFVILNPLNFRSEEQEKAAEILTKNGHPLLKLYIKDFYDLGGEFFRWETATAAAAFFMKINPFDQPNVQESKALTMEILKKLAQSGRLAEAKPDFDSEKISIHVSGALKRAGGEKIKNYSDIFWEIFSALKENEYFSILAYAEAGAKNDLRLKNLADTVRRFTASASFYSYGPRYLHSTGQLFKGGKDNGVFLMLTTRPKKDIKIEGEKYTFYQLNTAQAIGDFKALESKNRRVIRIHLKKNDFDACLKYLTDRIVEIGERKASPETEEKQMIKLADKKTTTPKTTPTKKIATTNTEYVVLDYPKNLETITARYYTIRIGATNCNNVEISINDQPWQNCRHSVGYWWYDWHNIKPGTYQILARMNKGNGQYLISKIRRCKVTY